MATKTITIVFRGLMVFNYQKGRMEIGFINGLPPKAENSHHHEGTPDDHANHLPVHIPRILTMRNGILASILDLRNRDELDTIRNWEIKATDVADPQVKIFKDGADFNRLASPAPNPRDFRWIADLEGPDLHNRKLSRELDTRQLLMVLYVRHGEFYTKMKSPAFRRVRVNPPPEEIEFGSTAAVTGCDISIETGSVNLVAGGAGSVFLFNESAEEGTIYEISNAPPDVPADAPTPPDEGGHFHMFYDKLFNNKPADQFDLIRDDQQPSPDPAQCGAGLLGQRDDPF